MRAILTILALLVLSALPVHAQTAAPLSAADIKAGMKLVTPHVFQCHATHRVPGLLKIKFDIAADGTVTSAAAQGAYAGTPMGTCAEGAIRHARFRPSGKGVGVTYPFKLR